MIEGMCARARVCVCVCVSKYHSMTVTPTEPLV